MKTNMMVLAVAGLALLGILALGGVWAFDFFLGETEAPSGPITAIPIALNTTAPTAPAATEAPATAAPDIAPTTSPSEAAPTEASAATATSESAPQTSGPVIFQISPGQSQVSFSIYEELAGQPKTVVGTTSEVAGEIAVNLADLGQTQVGVIQINARTFVTDNNRRNNAIRNFILQTDQYEFITFTPTAVNGLSGSAQSGQPFTFEVAGDLTIRDVTQPVVFSVTAQGESTVRLSGTATTIVKRSDYGLTIPSVSNVANVGEEVTLEFNFVAEA